MRLPDCLGGIERGHAQGLVEIEPDDAMDEAHGGNHVEVGAGKRAVGKPETPILAIDGAAVERERSHVGADRRHGVGDQQDLARGSFGAQRKRHRAGMDMDAIGDDAGVETACVDRRAGQPRLAIADLAHGVEEVRDDRRAGLGEGRRSGIAGVGMAEADDGAGLGQRHDAARLDGFGRDRGEQDRQIPARRDQRRLVGVGHRPNEDRIMGTLARDGKMRPFEMQAEKTGHFFPGGPGAGGDGHGGDRRRVGDQRRQQRRGAERRMCPADGFDRGDVGMVVEHDAAAAIDLDVDEAWDQQAGAGLDLGHAGRNGAIGQNGLDQAFVDDESRIVMPVGAIEDAGASEGETVAHRVSVTLRRLRGASGSRPRWRAKASTKP